MYWEDTFPGSVYSPGAQPAAVAEEAALLLQGHAVLLQNRIKGGQRPLGQAALHGKGAFRPQGPH